MAQSKPETIKIVDERAGTKEKWQLYIDGGRRAVLTKDDRGKFFLEIEIFGEFEWQEMSVFMIGLNRLCELAEGLVKKADVQQLLHTPTEEENAMAAKKAKVKAAKAAAKGKKKNGTGAPRESASALFKELIMDGKLTDDKIFDKVKAKFGLDDKKRSYVAWYRNALKKEGKKPPEAKE